MPSIIDDFNGVAGTAAHVANPAWGISGYGTATQFWLNGSGALACDGGANRRGIYFDVGSVGNMSSSKLAPILRQLKAFK